MSAPWRIDLSFSHTTGSITHSRPVNVPKPQSAEAIDPLTIADRLDRLLYAPRLDLRMLDEVGGRLDHSGKEDHVLGKWPALSAAYSWAWRGLAN